MVTCHAIQQWQILTTETHRLITIRTWVITTPIIVVIIKNTDNTEKTTFTT